MIRLFTAALLATLMGAGASMACEKHPRGHQSSSDTTSEVMRQ